jgi:predicted transcriptional regulator
MTKRPVSFRLESSKIKALDRIAKSIASNRNYLLTEAVENYLEFHLWQADQIQEGIREADAGQLIDHSVVVRRMRQKIRQRRKPRLIG